MIRYELKKILGPTGGKVALGLYAAMVILMCCLTVFTMKWVNEQGEHEIGPGAMKKMRDAQNQWEGDLDQELLTEVIRENQRIEATPQANSEDVTQSNIAFGWKQGFAPIRHLINNAYADSFRDYDYYTADGLTEIDEDTFYENRIRLLEQWLYDETGSAYGRFSEAEKQYILQKYGEMKTPLYFDYHEGWYQMLEYAGVISACGMLILGFLLAGIFTNESKWKADGVYFASRYGRSKAASAKVKAGVLLVTVVYWSAMLIYSLFHLCYMGFEGGTCMIQIRFFRSMYNLNFIQAWAVTMVCGYIGNLFVGLLVMFVCARSNSASFGVTVPVILLFLPSVLGGQADWLDRLLDLSPMLLLEAYQRLASFDLVTVFGKVLPALAVCAPVYLAACLALIPGTYQGFRRKQTR